MSGLRAWVLGVAAAAILAAMAQSLMPEGPVKGVGKLTCGLVLLAAVLRPLSLFDPAAGQRWLEDYFQQVEQLESGLEQDRQEQMKAVIEEKAAAYILDKAAELGIRCTVRVECEPDGDGLNVPVRIRFFGVSGGPEREKLSALAAEELNIPPAEQYFIQEGEP